MHNRLSWYLHCNIWVVLKEPQAIILAITSTPQRSRRGRKQGSAELCTSSGVLLPGTTTRTDPNYAEKRVHAACSRNSSPNPSAPGLIRNRQIFSASIASCAATLQEACFGLQRQKPLWQHRYVVSFAMSPTCRGLGAPSSHFPALGASVVPNASAAPSKTLLLTHPAHCGDSTCIRQKPPV